MIQAVLFDLGQTLLEYQRVDSRTLFHNAAQHTYDDLAARGCALPSFDRFFSMHKRALRWEKLKAKLAGREIDSFKLLRQMCVKLGLQRDPGTVNRLGWLWYEPAALKATVAPGAAETLQSLHDASIRLGIVANAPVPGEVIDEHLNQLGLLHFFEVRIYSSDVGYRKPEQQIFDAALRELNLPAENVAYIGDSIPNDVVPARRAGMTAILKCARPGFRAKRAANFVVTSLLELPALIGVGVSSQSCVAVTDPA